MGNNIKIQPKFEGLENPETFINHVKGLVDTQKSVGHKKILDRLLEEIEPIDYQERVFSGVFQIRKSLDEQDSNIDEFEKQLDDLKLKENHLLIETIENLLELAKKNNWGLCKNQGRTYIYNGAYWASIEKETLQKFLGDAAERMGVSRYRARYYRFQENLVRQFYASAYLQAPEPSPDKVMINLLNGTYEITPKSRGLRPFNANDFLTHQLPFEYDPKAKAPIFNEYLNKVLPDKDSQKSLSEFLGYVFISPRTLKLEKALILYGSGANGKSVFFEIVNSLLGEENITNYSLQSLTDEKGYQRAKFGGSLLNYASEISVHMNNAIFKQLVSGEPVDARLPYGEPFMLTNYGKLLFNCNRLPRDVEQTNAFFRRFLIVHFNVTIPEDEQDKTLHTKIIDQELSGVFNWMLEGLDRLLIQKRFTESEASKRNLDEYRRSSDNVMQFIEECCSKEDADYCTTVRDLYSAYKSYTLDGGYRPVSCGTLRERLQENGITVWQDRKVYVAKLTHPSIPTRKI